MPAKKKKYALDRNYESVGVFLREHRLKAGLTQLEVSRALGYSDQHLISNIERGIYVPPLNKLKIMVDLYKIDPNKLIEEISKADRAVMTAGLIGRSGV